MSATRVAASFHAQARGPSRAVGLFAAALTLVAQGCSHPATAIVVVVDSDLAVPGEIASVHADVGGMACADTTCAHDFTLASAAALPFSFTVTPHGGDSGPLALTLRGRDAAGSDRVVRSVSSSFVAGRTLVLRVSLEHACVGAPECRVDATTCIGGACASAVVDPASLSDVIPGRELDGGARPDTTVAEDTGLDAHATDTGLDAPATDAGDGGTIPRSCAALPSGSASGPYTIDPDGPGGAAPFLDYCETSADGGGWTLLAKVDPRTTTLGYDAVAWTAVSSAAAFGTADLAVGDALLPSYWTLAVGELRFVMAPAATPTTTTSLVTTFTPASTITLRSAMESGSHVRFDATLAQWVALIGASSTPGAATCEQAGVPVGLPEATPVVRVRVGYVWADTTGCATPGFWAGLGAAGMGCRAVASASGGGRLCGTGAQRRDFPLVTWLFGR